MSLAKVALVVVVAVAAYFIFFASSLPGHIEYRGNTLGPMQEVENNSTGNFEIVSYRDSTNYHVLFFLMPEDQSVTAQDLVEFYLGNFEAQGYSFRKDGTMNLGLKGDEVIYLTVAARMNAAIAYVEKDPNPLPRTPGDASDVFASLKDFSFD